MKPKDTPCAACGMPCAQHEYHPYLACLAFQKCRDGSTVRANLAAVVEYGARGGSVTDIRKPLRKGAR